MIIYILVESVDIWHAHRYSLNCDSERKQSGQ